MEPRINIITLGVKEVSRARQFYEQGLGWRISSASNEHIVFIKTTSVILALYPTNLLAEDATLSPEGSGFRRFTLAHNVSQPALVAEILNQAQKAGGKIIKPAQDTFWGGHSGYFADPDDHLWEVAWNPHFSFDLEGNLKLPD